MKEYGGAYGQGKPLGAARSGFTLVELLGTIAIIFVLVGLLTPVLARAKRAALQTVGVSNLHQLSQALIIYADDHGGPEWMPPFETAQRLVAKLPKCDPLDDWSPACKDRDERPLLGSYGYAPAIIEDGGVVGPLPGGIDSWAKAAVVVPGFPLLASGFAGNESSCKFFNGNVWDAGWHGWVQACVAGGRPERLDLPNPVLRVNADGSVRRYQHTPRLPATWNVSLAIWEQGSS